MLNAKLVLLLLLVVVAVAYIIYWAIHLRKNLQRPPSILHCIIGFVTDFLDTLGVGSFATTSSIYRTTKLVDDALLPGTLNVGHALPTILQAFIYITVIEIDITTLWLLIIASILGATAGANLVTRLNKQAIQLGMGFALLCAAMLIIAGLLAWVPSGGDELELSGSKLVAACVANFVFGALMTIGVGAYAPIMIMVSLLGMNQKAAFPIMMGSCAFLMPIASYKFIASQKYDPRAALGLTLLGLPAVAIAAWVVKSLDTWAIKYLVVIVVLYTGINMILAGIKASRKGAPTN